MVPRVHDALTGSLQELRPERPPRLSFLAESPPEAALRGLRLRTVGACLAGALRHLGLEPSEPAAGEAVELYCGASEPPVPARRWLKVAPPGRELSGIALEAAGLGAGELRLLCLMARYAEPLDLGAAALRRAREDLAFLKAQARRLAAAGGPAAHASGLAGYKKRFRDALADDLDLPRALQSLFDALRPGALSPGSQAGALLEADAVLGLGLL